MAGRAVKPAFTDKMRDPERGGYTAKGAKVRAALPSQKEGRTKKETRKPKRALGRR